MTATKTQIYMDESLQLLDKKNLPKHIAIIPDGNRRWAKKHRMSKNTAYEKGGEHLANIVNASLEIGIETVSFYLFSTENWLRPRWEVNSLITLLQQYLIKEEKSLIEKDIRLSVIGDITRFSSKVQKTLQDVMNSTNHCKSIQVIFALNYGGRDDIRRAVQKIASKVEKKEICKEEITEDLIAQHLDTSKYGDPDLLIRTSGEERISNFFLWQLSYTEMFFSPMLWPDFTEQCFLQVIIDFQKRERRIGGK